MIDTKEFDVLSAPQYKQQTKMHWSRNPCGSNYGSSDNLTDTYFKEIESHRYSTHPWIKRHIQQFDIKNKKVLEIGYGMGTDHLNMARQGAILHGVDLTPKNLAITEKHLAFSGFKSTLITGDAENIEHADNSMDFVYSFGVIHHSPNTEKIISEIYRILKPNGRCWVTVYHKHSVFFWWSIFLVDWIFRGGFSRERLKSRISRIEYPNDNPNMVIKLYTRSETRKLFSKFRDSEVKVDHLISDDVFYFGKWLPERMMSWLAKRFGWYIIIGAKK